MTSLRLPIEREGDVPLHDLEPTRRYIRDHARVHEVRIYFQYRRIGVLAGLLELEKTGNEKVFGMSIFLQGCICIATPHPSYATED